MKKKNPVRSLGLPGGATSPWPLIRWVANQVMRRSVKPIPKGIPVHPKLREVVAEDVRLSLERLAKCGPAEIYDGTAIHLFELFVIHAEHHISILSTPDQVNSLYAPYLIDLIEKTIDYGKNITGHWTGMLDPNRLIRDVRASMVAGMPDWISEANTFTRRAEPEKAVLLPVEHKPRTAVLPALKKKRREVVSEYRRRKGLQMEGLGRHLGISTTAVYGMINGDEKRYSPEVLDAFLTKIGISREDWDLV